jgi:hypothetical protein
LSDVLWSNIGRKLVWTEQGRIWVLVLEPVSTDSFPANVMVEIVHVSVLFSCI